MVIWAVLDLCNLILDRAGGPGLTALHLPQLFLIVRTKNAGWALVKSPGTEMLNTQWEGGE